MTHSAGIIGLGWRGSRGFEEISLSSDPVIKLPQERRGRGGLRGRGWPDKGECPWRGVCGSWGGGYCWMKVLEFGCERVKMSQGALSPRAATHKGSCSCCCFSSVFLMSTFSNFCPQAKCDSTHGCQARWDFSTSWRNSLWPTRGKLRLWLVNYKATRSQHF